MEGGLRVHEVDLRQSLPTVLKAVEDKFKKLDASLAEVVTEVRRLGRESVGRGEQCQGTEALKACVAKECQGTEALKACVASACQGTEALRMESLRNWSKAETRVGRLEADMEASRVARQEGSAEMAQMQIRQAQLEQRIFQLEAETLRLAKEATQPPSNPSSAERTLTAWQPMCVAKFRRKLRMKRVPVQNGTEILTTSHGRQTDGPVKVRHRGGTRAPRNTPKDGPTQGASRAEATSAHGVIKHGCGTRAAGAEGQASAPRARHGAGARPRDNPRQICSLQAFGRSVCQMPSRQKPGIHGSHSQGRLPT